MCVAKDDHLWTLAPHSLSQRLGQRVGIDDVVQKKLLPGQLEAFSQPVAQPGIVGVSHYGRNGGDVLQLMQDSGKADVSPVEDVADAFEEAGESRVEEIVSVGDDADFQRGGRLVRRRRIHLKPWLPRELRPVPVPGPAPHRLASPGRTRPSR